MEEKSSPVEHLLESVASALGARRGPMVERVRGIELALESYRRAVEAELVREFAREHGFKQPPAAAMTPQRAAELLHAAVQALPELRESLSTREPPSAKPPVSNPAAAMQAPTSSASGGGSSSYPRLLARVAQGKIVVIGALSGRDRGPALPSELSEQVEWIDTERDGAHAVGNLPQRLRQGRVAAVVILDRVVQHKHTEPVMAAARDSGVPFAFAGQGGKASLVRALEQLEAALAQSSA
jgi:hypothetical protein